MAGNTFHNRLRIARREGSARLRGSKETTVQLVIRRVSAWAGQPETKVQVSMTEAELLTAMTEAGYTVTRA